MRNDLLAQIVVASGGVVTNPFQRNSLLQDWLDATSSNDNFLDGSGAIYNTSVMDENSELWSNQ